MFELHRYDILAAQLAFAALDADYDEVGSIFLGRYPFYLESLTKSDQQISSPTAKGQQATLPPNYLLILYSVLTDEVCLQQVLLESIKSRVREENPLVVHHSSYQAAMFNLMHEIFAIQPSTTPVPDILLKMNLVCPDKTLVDNFCLQYTTFNTDKQKLEFKPGFGKNFDSDIRSDPLLLWPLPGAFKDWTNIWSKYYAVQKSIQRDFDYALQPLVRQFNSFALLNQIKLRAFGQNLLHFFEPVVAENHRIDLRSEHQFAILRISMLMGKELFKEVVNKFPSSFVNKLDTEILKPQVMKLLESALDSNPKPTQGRSKLLQEILIRAAQARRLDFFNPTKSAPAQDSPQGGLVEASKPLLIDRKPFYYYPAQVHIVSVSCYHYLVAGCRLPQEL